MRVVVRLPAGDAAVRGSVLQETIAIYRKRLDPAGKRHVRIEAQGADRIVIDLPALEVNALLPDVVLASSMDAGARTAELAMGSEGELALRGIPPGGGAIEIDGELVLYERRGGNRLVGLTRGSADVAKPHAAGALVRIVANEPLGKWLTSPGELRFLIEALDSHFTSAGTDLAREHKDVLCWMDNHPEAASLHAYDVLPRESGGPPARPEIRWFTRAEDSERGVPFAERDPVAVTIEEKPAWRFSGADLDVGRLRKTADDTGFPALEFRIEDTRAEDFGDFTEAHVEEKLAIVLDDEILTMPRIKSRLPGGGRIEGGGPSGFPEERVGELFTLLRSGVLPVRPQIESLSVR
jgi:hypothetical protein